MADQHFDPRNDLDLRLRAAAAATRPAFSPELHERTWRRSIRAKCFRSSPGQCGLRRPLAIAAGLLIAVTGAALAGYSLTEMLRNQGQSGAPTVAAAPSGEMHRRLRRTTLSGCSGRWPQPTILAGSMTTAAALPPGWWPIWRPTPTRPTKRPNRPRAADDGSLCIRAESAKCQKLNRLGASLPGQDELALVLARVVIRHERTIRCVGLVVERPDQAAQVRTAGQRDTVAPIGHDGERDAVAERHHFEEPAGEPDAVMRGVDAAERGVQRPAVAGAAAFPVSLPAARQVDRQGRSGRSTSGQRGEHEQRP